MSAILAIVIGGVTGLVAGSASVPPALQSLPIIIRVAKLGVKLVPREYRELTEKEIAAIEQTGAAQSVLGDWF